jgi:hypothetical protein
LNGIVASGSGGLADRTQEVQPAWVFVEADERWFGDGIHWLGIGRLARLFGTDEDPVGATACWNLR